MEIKIDDYLSKDEKIKIENPINKVTWENPDDKYNKKGFCCWHKYLEYKLNGATIIVSDSLGGCGVQHLYGWYKNFSHNNKNIFKLLKYVIKNLDSGVGLLTCQVGSAFLDSLLVEALVKLNFTYVEYRNYQHGGLEKGRLYTLVIQKN